MGKGRGKVRKASSVVHSHEESGEDVEVIPVSKRRGRPPKPVKKVAIEKGEVEDMDVDGDGDGDGDDSSKSGLSQKLSGVSENGRKIKNNSRVNESQIDSLMKEEISDSGDGEVKSAGLRKTGSSRRKSSTPRRALRAGIDF